MGHHHRVVRPVRHDGLDVIFAYGNRQLPGLDDGGGLYTMFGRLGRNLIECSDGYVLSVTAGPSTHCWPRPVDRPRLLGEVPITYPGPYVAVEVSSCSAPPEPHEIWRHLKADDYAGGLYSLVPTALVRELINRHGGFRRMAPGNVNPRTIRRARQTLQRLVELRR